MRITYNFVLVSSIGVIAILVAAVMVAGASSSGLKGDLNCNGSVNPVDSLLLLRHDAGLSVNLPPGCDAIGSTAAGAARGLSAVNPKGDMNCNGSVNPVDSLLLLRHDAGLNVNLPAGCDAIGSSAPPDFTLPPKPSFTAAPTATQPPATPTPTSTATQPPVHPHQRLLRLLRRRLYRHQRRRRRQRRRPLLRQNRLLALTTSPCLRSTLTPTNFRRR